MELNNIKTSHKKPAMALVLIIIIITSVTVIIMGTVKIITSTSGRYSINRNAKGVLNIKKPLGSYICFIYDGKLYQSTVLYDTDGSIAEGYPKIEPLKTGTMNNCTFKIPDGVSRLNFTLIGGGAAGGLQYYEQLRYIQDKSKRNGLSAADLLDSNNFNSKYQLSWRYSNKKVGADEIFPSIDDNDNINKDDIKKMCCYNDIASGEVKCYLNYGSVPGDMKNNTNYQLLYGTDNSGFKPGDEDAYACWHLRIYDDSDILVFNSDIRDIYLPEGDKKKDDFVKFVAEKMQDQRVCIYNPYISYASLKASKPGDVQQSSILVSELQDDTEAFTFCKSTGNKCACDGCVGQGDIFKTGDKTEMEINSTKTELNLKFKDINAPKPRPTNTAETNNLYTSIKFKMLEDNNYLIRDLRDLSGQEADYTLSDEFGIKSNTDYQFDLHTGYYDDANAKAIPATLFGASGVVLRPKQKSSNSEKVCNFNNANTYRMIDVGSQCPAENGSGTCSSKKNNQPAGYLNGAPGAIIIEW